MRWLPSKWGPVASSDVIIACKNPEEPLGVTLTARGAARGVSVASAAGRGLLSDRCAEKWSVGPFPAVFFPPSGAWPSLWCAHPLCITSRCGHWCLQRLRPAFSPPQQPPRRRLCAGCCRGLCRHPHVHCAHTPLVGGSLFTSPHTAVIFPFAVPSLPPPSPPFRHPPRQSFPPPLSFECAAGVCGCSLRCGPPDVPVHAFEWPGVTVPGVYVPEHHDSNIPTSRCRTLHGVAPAPRALALHHNWSVHRSHSTPRIVCSIASSLRRTDSHSHLPPIHPPKRRVQRSV